jgi:hypothetical protein
MSDADGMSATPIFDALRGEMRIQLALDDQKGAAERAARTRKSDAEDEDESLLRPAG